MSDDRPSWDSYFKEITSVTAKRSACHRLHVGCLLVKDNRIISQGYNGYLPGAPHEQVMRNGHEIATVHAEQNAVTDCAKRGVSCNNATAYITHYPCINCMKIMCAAGINEIKYIDDYRNDDMIPYFANLSNITVTKLD
uniref:CMP/dCMP-type deaminase domain-containing protein n=1 Tax=viral metagenome TaxID=1070528 RepID=A0A6C0CPS0_9ZZZZ